MVVQVLDPLSVLRRVQNIASLRLTSRRNDERVDGFGLRKERMH